jgi:hypothetical protein
VLESSFGLLQLQVFLTVYFWWSLQFFFFARMVKLAVAGNCELPSSWVEVLQCCSWFGRHGVRVACFVSLFWPRLL